MILKFSVTNYKVFKDRATMSFIASNYDKSTLENQNVKSLPDLGIRMLNSAVLYGANASVKTKFFEALELICSQVVKWFTQGVVCLSCMHESGYKNFSLMQTDQNNNHDKILDLLRRADLHIQDINVETLSPDNLPNSAPPELRTFLKENMLSETTKIYSDVITSHHKYNGENKIIGSMLFSLEKDESHGTQKFFYLSDPIMDVLEHGKTVFIDELDARLHPNLVQRIFSLFNNPDFNSHGAQLVATTHNTSLLRSDRLRKDQIWFIEKDNHEAAHLYSLADFKSTEVRSNENYETNYLRGKYGATPYLQGLDHLKNRVSEEVQ